MTLTLPPDEVWKGTIRGLDVAVFRMRGPEGPAHHPHQAIDLIGVARQLPTVVHPNADRREALTGFHLVGGGALVDYGNGAGSLLTAIYPETLKRWIARAKDHLEPSPATIRGYCVAARLPESDLHIEMTERRAPHTGAQAEAVLPREFALVGGGAQALLEELPNAGVLLTASTPNTKTWASWIARAKDHEQESPVQLRAYAIGIRKTVLQKLGLKVVHAEGIGPGASHPSATIGGPKSFPALVTCGGALVEYGSGAGNMLTASWPYRQQIWKAMSKDHDIVSRARIRIALLGLAPA
jgi:hypothetical protein